MKLIVARKAVPINATEKSRVEKSADKRPLIELINLWYQYHGQQLKTGEKELKHLIAIDADLGHPRADQVTKSISLNIVHTRY